MRGVDGWGGQASRYRRADGSGGDGARKRHGRHYTPVRLAEFLATRLLAHSDPRRPGELRVLDPACGDGELLVAARRMARLRFPRVRVRLIGYDVDEAAIRVAAAREPDIEWRVGDFLQAATTLDDEGFDAVITNPPYVRTQQLGAETARMLSQRFGLQGRIDLTHPFVA
ncbi:N-6 DNA methylase, partial [Nocardia gipuzkoensis]